MTFPRARGRPEQCNSESVKITILLIDKQAESILLTILLTSLTKETFQEDLEFSRCANTKTDKYFTWEMKPWTEEVFGMKAAPKKKKETKNLYQNEHITTAAQKWRRKV